MRMLNPDKDDSMGSDEEYNSMYEQLYEHDLALMKELGRFDNDYPEPARRGGRGGASGPPGGGFRGKKKKKKGGGGPVPANSYYGGEQVVRDPFSDNYYEPQLSYMKPSVAQKSFQPLYASKPGAHLQQKLLTQFVQPREKVNVAVETRKVYVFSPVGTQQSLSALKSMLEIASDNATTYELLLQSLVFSEHLLAYHNSAMLDDLK